MYERITIILGTKERKRIASRLRCRLEDVEAYRKKGVIPDSWRIQLYELYGVRPLWLITGRGPMSLLDANIPPDFIPCLSGKILMMLSEVEGFDEYIPLQVYVFYRNIEHMVKDMLERSFLGVNNRIDSLM